MTRTKKSEEKYQRDRFLRLLLSWNQGVALALAQRWMESGRISDRLRRAAELQRGLRKISRVQAMAQAIEGYLPRISVEIETVLGDITRPMTEDDRAALLTRGRLFPETDHVVCTLPMTCLKADR